MQSISQISINSFGSVIGGMTLDDNETYFGNDDRLAFQPESRFALQIGAPLAKNGRQPRKFWRAAKTILIRLLNGPTSVIRPLMTENPHGGDNASKIYKCSDYVDVGCAYPWLRTPQGVYALPFSPATALVPFTPPTVATWR